MGSRRQALLPARGPRAGPCADGVGGINPGLDARLFDAVSVTEPWAWRPALPHDQLLTQAQILDDQVRSGFPYAAAALPAHLITPTPSLRPRPAGSLSQGRPEGKDGGSSSCALQVLRGEVYRGARVPSRVPPRRIGSAACQLAVSWDRNALPRVRILRPAGFRLLPAMRGEAARCLPRLRCSLFARLRVLSTLWR